MEARAGIEPTYGDLQFLTGHLRDFPPPYGFLVRHGFTGGLYDIEVPGILICLPRSFTRILPESRLQAPVVYTRRLSRGIVRTLALARPGPREPDIACPPLHQGATRASDDPR